MDKPEWLKIAAVLTTFFVSACVMDWQADIAIVKNNSTSQILIAKQPYELMTDSILYNQRFSETWIDSHKSSVISLPNRKPSAEPDSIKTYLYIFNCDSLHKFQTSERAEGIVKSSLMRKIEIQDNKVREPLDTIYIK